MKTKNQKILKLSSILFVFAGLLVAILLQVNPVQAETLDPETCTLVDTTRTCDLYASSGTLTGPNGEIIDIWGYSFDGVTATVPGPIIIANEGETLVVNLHNNLSEPTGLYFQGQAMIPDREGAAVSGTKTYTIESLSPGTFLYEAALLPSAQHQVPMGLFGALVVRPTIATQAYGPASAFQDEALLVLSEIDPALNADPTNFDMRDFSPEFFMINGKAYPDTDEIPSTPGNTLLLRMVNAGMFDHTMGLLGLEQTIIATDGFPLGYPRELVTWTVAPGQSADTLVTLPGTTPAGGGNYALYDSSLMLHNGPGGEFGGMLTHITLADGVVPPIGPITTSVELTPNWTGGGTEVTLTATIPGSTSAEYFIDLYTGVDGSGTTMDETADDNYAVTLSAAEVDLLNSGSHTFFVHGTDGTTWGPYNIAVLHLDKQGPMTKVDEITPNPSNGAMDVLVRATGDDRMSGNSNIASAELRIDGGAPISMIIESDARVASMNATIPAAAMGALAEGEHTLSITSTDVWGNTGMPVEAPLMVDQTGPVVSALSATPDVLETRGPVRLDVTLTDEPSGTPAVNSNLQNAEAFIDAVGEPGTGFPLISRDGLFDEPSEEAYADIPFATINSLTDGVHTLHVRGIDSAGNWGPINDTNFIIEPQVLFTDGFETGTFENWENPITPAAVDATILNVTNQAAHMGNYGMEVALSGETTGYISDLTPDGQNSYLVSFYFNPNDVMPDNADTEGITIFSGQDAGNMDLFQVQLRRQAGDVFQVRLAVLHVGGIAKTDWFTITNDWHKIQMLWHSDAAAFADFYIDGALEQTLFDLDTSTYILDAVRLGPSTGILGTNASGVMFFDDFASYQTTRGIIIIDLDNYYFLPLLLK